MRAFQITQNVHPSEVSIVDVDAPKPSGDDQVLVDVYSAALNFFDILQSQGKYQNQPKHPFILGSEFAGRISSNSPIPKNCPYKRGDRVFGAAQGAFGEKVVAKWSQLLPLPSNLNYNEAAGLFVTWPTSYEALVGRVQCKAGDWVLVTAAAGGVGIAAVQIAKALGAKVIAAAGSQDKLDVAKNYGGADYVVDYSKNTWQKEVLSITGGRGVDIVYDPVGKIKESLKCIAWKGRAIVVGFAGGQIEQVPMNLVLLKNISLVGIHWGAYTTKEPGHIPSVWKGLLDMIASGRAKPVVYSKVYSFDELVEGLSALEKRKTWGKVIVKIRDDTTDAKL